MNKKSIIWIIALLVCAAIVLTVVNKLMEKKESTNEVSFTATVLENKKTTLLVEPEKGQDELNSSDRISVSVVKDGEVFEDLSQFTEGSRVKITYDGTIMESYPAQIRAFKVEWAK
ncbi:MAG: DUF3221 domain-containing protein [Sedimentibacter sp.]|uniref:DUF3221 domain-containing protein n=1 Tax=Sedimentibacter sp. TaxID=1960295 RepID=UPI003157FF37